MTDAPDDLIPPSAMEPAKPEWTFDRPPGVPPQGIYAGKSYEWYAAIEAVNASALKVGATVSALHMKATIDGRLSSDSRARKFGRAVHCRLLEPSRYADEILVAMPCAAILKSGPNKGEPCGKESSLFSEMDEAWCCGRHASAFTDATEPKDYVSQGEASRIERMVESVKAHAVIKMLRSHGGCETTLVWDEDGIPCKARLDKHIFGSTCPDTVLDIKKMRPCAGDEETLQYAIRDYGWDLQAYWYSHGAEVVTGKPHRFAWVFIEDDFPFGVRPLWASRRMIEVGRSKANQAFRVYKWCLQAGEWPGYTTEIEELDPANWECKRYGLGG